MTISQPPLSPLVLAPLVLGLDTTDNFCSAALVGPAHIAGRRMIPMRKGHAEALGPMVDDLLRTTNTKPRDLGKIVVCTGPGSFTGQRVALGFAKGLALPHRTELVGVSTLEVWAKCADPEQSQTITAIADVRRGDVFWQTFVGGQAVSKPTLQNAHDFAHDFSRSNQRSPLGFGALVGSGVSTIAALSSAPLSSTFALRSPAVPPEILAWIGSDLSALTHAATPLYHRPPDAKLPGGIEPQNQK